MVDTEWEQRRRYSLLQDDILPKMQDRNFFVDAIIHNYVLTGHRVGLFPLCSERRIIEAFSLWQTDIDRTLAKGTDSRTFELDHFKHASFIAFWLRRMIPINEIKIISPQGTDVSEDRHERRRRYFMYGNELSAFLVGYKICINYELGTISNRPAGDRITPKNIDYIASRELPDRLLDDYLMIWKHKNISPYALYLMYKSLFMPLGGLALGLVDDVDVHGQLSTR